MLFRKKDQEFNRATAKQTITFLYEQLKHLEIALGQELDTILDSTSLPSTVGNEIDVGNGQNIVLAKTRGKTYTLGRKSSGSIIVANKFTQGTGKSTITGGDDRNSLNAVVVGVGSGGMVDIFPMGPHDVIVTDALSNEVQFYRDSDKTCLKDSQQRDLIKGRSTGNCKRLIFKKSENTQIIVNCQEYISGRIYSFVLFRSIPSSSHMVQISSSNLTCHSRKPMQQLISIILTTRGGNFFGCSSQSPIHQSVLVPCGSHTCLFQQATHIQRN